MLKRITSILCIITFLTPITFNIHNSARFQMAKVDKVNNFEEFNTIEKGIIPYKKQYYIKMLNEIGEGLLKQSEEKREVPGWWVDYWK